MSKASKVLYFTPEQRAAVDVCIRRHHYINILKVVELLDKDGIKISKSSLQRYAAQLRLQDAQLAGTKADTLVIIVERGTGAVTNLTSGASRDAIAGVIAGLEGHPTVS